MVDRLHRSARACLLLGALAASGCSQDRPAAVAGGDAVRGHAAVLRYGCAACHTIPGVPSYGANVGPPLAGLAKRSYLAGVLPNTPENLVRWLRDPPQVDPRTAMPRLGVSDTEAADIAAFLYAAR